MLYQHTKQTARGNVNKATVVCTSSRDSTTSSRDSTWTLDVHVLQAAARRYWSAETARAVIGRLTT